MTEYTKIVVKKGNGEASKDQIDSAIRAANAGQVFAVINSFDEEPKASIIIDDKIAKDIDKYEDEKGFEIQDIDKITDDPDEPGESDLKETKRLDNPEFQQILLESGYRNNDIFNILDVLKDHPNHTIQSLGEILEYELYKY